MNEQSKRHSNESENLGKSGRKQVWIRHSRSGMNPTPEPPAHPAQVLDKHLPVALLKKNVRARIPARHHVIERAFKFDAKRTGHGDKLVESTA